MCTVFPYCRIGVQRLLAANDTFTATGSFVGGPWALRPERLEWLTNIAAGFKIAAFPPGLWPLSSSSQNSASGQSLAGAFPPARTTGKAGFI